VISPEHHSRHLQSEEERAEFHRTAPIETSAYWDLADSLHDPARNTNNIEQYKGQVFKELHARSKDTPDEGKLPQIMRYMDRIIDQGLKH
jgi:hypothetical protein